MESMECPRLFICSPGYAQHFLDITLKNKSQNTEIRFCHDFNGALWHKYNFCNCTSASITDGKIVTYVRRQIKGVQLSSCHLPELKCNHVLHFSAVKWHFEFEWSDSSPHAVLLISTHPSARLVADTACQTIFQWKRHRCFQRGTRAGSGWKCWCAFAASDCILTQAVRHNINLRQCFPWTHQGHLCGDTVVSR